MARAMAKYDRLRGYLRRRRHTPDLELSFAEIERILGVLLPKSAATAQWWGNVKGCRGTHVQRNAWRDAGFDAFLVAGRERVRFRRVLSENRPEPREPAGRALPTYLARR